MKLPMRKDVPEELTWDLRLIYPTAEDMKKDAEHALALAGEIAASCPGTLQDPEAIAACLDRYMEVRRILTLTGNYTELAVSVDYYDTEAQAMQAFTDHVASSIGASLSFLEDELLQQKPDVLTRAAELRPEHAGYLKDLLRKQPHHLPSATQKALAALKPALNCPYQVYNMAKLADMQFDSFTVNGKEYPLGYSLYEDDYSYEKDTAVRRTAFEVFSRKLRQYQNTTAAAYNSAVMQEKILATLRGFDSVFDYLLFPQKVTREMYDRQIDQITTKLAPHMRRYARLLQKIHGLDRMTYADLKLSVDPDYTPSVTIPQCHRYVREGLSVLGPDYTAMIDEAFAHRWFDFAKNQGKSTGGFCASPYGKGSFILLSWNDRMADVFTVAHELGHAGHFGICNSTQSLYDTDVSSYMVEAPSTMNELLMAHHMLRTSDDPRFRRWVLSSMVGFTYYHNCVTHLLEAWYQREVYRIIDAGGSVTAEVLNDIFRRNLTNFWGDAVELTEGAELTWMRQPHYYMGLYSYTYSAGLTLATQACKRIEKEGQPAVDDWLRMLAAGSTEDPMGLARIAGIDLSTDAALIDTIDTIGGMIEEIIRLTEEIDGITIE